VGWVCEVLTPQVGQRSGWPVVRMLNAKMGGNALSQVRIDGNDACLAVQRQKAMALGERFKFVFDLGLVKDEGLKQIVRKRKVSTRFPITDRMRFAKLALERHFRAHIEPEREIGTNRHFVKAAQVVTLNAAGYRAGDQSIKVTVRKNNKIGT